MRTGSFAIFVLLVFAVAAPHASAAPSTAPSPPASSGDDLRVLLLTFGPGSDPWEKFGHDAIVILDGQTHESVAYNWGVFNFGQGVSGFTSFAWHFLRGRLVYSMESEPAEEMLAEYKMQNRSTLLQELNLTSAQKLELRDRLVANDTEANRYYLYDYFKKNCATMARDAIDETVNGRVHAALDHLPTGTTYRWHDRRSTADTLWLYFFLDYALGQPIDRPLSAWQECFLPGKLAVHLLSVQVPDAQGKLVPLVIESRKWNTGIFPERAVPPGSFVYGFLAAGACCGFTLACLGWFAQQNRVAGWAFALACTVWSLLAGSLGAVITFALFTNHDAAKWNENWLQCNPLSLLLVILMPISRRRPRPRRIVAFAVLGLSACGLLAKLTPWAWQSNWDFIALALPIHAAAAWVFSRRAIDCTAAPGRLVRAGGSMPDLVVPPRLRHSDERS